MSDVTKVRVGLAMIGVVIAVALGTMLAIDEPAGKAVMFAIALTALVRFYLLYRSLRRDRAVGRAAPRPGA